MGMNIHEISPEQWLEELFEFEYCAECGGDVEDHDAIVFMGNWFARCKNEFKNEFPPPTGTKCPGCGAEDWRKAFVAPADVQCEMCETTFTYDQLREET